MLETLNEEVPGTFFAALAQLKSHQAYVKLTAEAGTAKTLEELLDVVSRFVPTVLGVPRATLTMLTPTKTHIKVVALGGQADALSLGDEMPIEGTAIGVAIDSCQPVTTADRDISEFRDWQQLSEEHNLEQFIVVPLEGTKGPLGTFNLGRPGQPVDEHEVSRAQRFARVVATHIELHQGIQKLQESLELLANAQEKLVSQARAAVLGDMVASWAHELNTPIGVSLTANSLIDEAINDLTDNMKSGTLTRRKLAESITRIREGADLTHTNLKKAVGLMAEFKAVASEHHRKVFERIDMKAHLERSIRLLHPILRQHGVRVELEGDETQVTTSPDLLHQFVTNLIQNSCVHAFNGIEDPTIIVSIFSQDTTVQIDVRDNGIGMDSTTQQKVFEPFFTTRRDQGGTGLGLHLCRQFAQSMGGTIELKSTLSGGTSFRLTLPRINHADSGAE